MCFKKKAKSGSKMITIIVSKRRTLLCISEDIEPTLWRTLNQNCQFQKSQFNFLNKGIKQ